MLRPRTLANVNRKRTLHAEYAHTQATAFAAVLSPNFDRTAGQLSGAQAVTNSQTAILPGSVAVKLAGTVVTLFGSNEGTGTDTAVAPVVRPFGLFANFVGGNLDELFDRSEVTVWQGVNSYWRVLAPAFNATGLSTVAAAESGVGTAFSNAGAEVYLIPGTDGRMLYQTANVAFGQASTQQPVARLINFLSPNAIVVQLLV